MASVPAVDLFKALKFLNESWHLQRQRNEVTLRRARHVKIPDSRRAFREILFIYVLYIQIRGMNCNRRR